MGEYILTDTPEPTARETLASCDHRDALTAILRLFDHAVSSRARTLAMHFEVRAPESVPHGKCRQALDCFLDTFISALKREGHRPLYAWSRTRSGGDSYRPGFGLILLLDASKADSVANQLRNAEGAWALALGIDDASGFVGYYDRDEHGDQLGNGILLHGDAPGIAPDWCECYRWAKQLAEHAGDRSAPVGLPRWGCSRTD